MRAVEGTKGGGRDRYRIQRAVEETEGLAGTEGHGGQKGCGG
jgi:hypothetical protein